MPTFFSGIFVGFIVDYFDDFDWDVYLKPQSLQNPPTQTAVQIAKDNGITKRHMLFWTRYAVDAGQQQYQTTADHVKTVVTNDRSKIGQIKVVTIINKDLPLLKYRTFIKYVAPKWLGKPWFNCGFFFD